MSIPAGDMQGASLAKKRYGPYFDPRSRRTVSKMSCAWQRKYIGRSREFTASTTALFETTGPPKPVEDIVYDSRCWKWDILPLFSPKPSPRRRYSSGKHGELCSMITHGGGHQALNVSPTGGALGQVPLLGNSDTNIYT